MPIYEYQCSRCKNITERYLPYGIGSVICDHPGTDNPSETCGGEAVKILSAAAMVYERKYQLNGKEWG